MDGQQIGSGKALGPCLLLLLRYPSTVSERCNLDSIMMQSLGRLGTVAMSSMGGEQMSVPETVVAALALALTRLALLRALAQNSQGQRLPVSLKIELISWPGAGVFWPNSGSGRGAGPQPQDKVRQPGSEPKPSVSSLALSRSSSLFTK